MLFRSYLRFSIFFFFFFGLFSHDEVAALLAAGSPTVADVDLLEPTPPPQRPPSSSSSSSSPSLAHPQQNQPSASVGPQATSPTGKLSRLMVTSSSSSSTQLSGQPSASHEAAGTTSANGGSTFSLRLKSMIRLPSPNLRNWSPLDVARPGSCFSFALFLF